MDQNYELTDHGLLELAGVIAPKQSRLPIGGQFQVLAPDCRNHGKHGKQEVRSGLCSDAADLPSGMTTRCL